MSAIGSKLGILYFAIALFILCNVGTTHGYSIFGILISLIAAMHIVIFGIFHIGVFADSKLRRGKTTVRSSAANHSKAITSIALPILAIAMSIAAISLDSHLDDRSQRRGDELLVLADRYYNQHAACPESADLLVPLGANNLTPLVRGSHFEFQKGRKENCAIRYVSTRGYYCQTDLSEGYWYCDDD